MKKAIEAAPLKAVGPYSLAIEAGGFVHCSGQIHLDPASGSLVDGDIAAQTKQCMDNLTTVLAGAGLDFSDVVKCVVFLVDMGDFGEVNKVYETYMVAPFPARSCIQVAALPLGARVEVECVAKTRS
ncbi:MAG: Rid family detoxifying hydrolase [Pseudomonadota bacterium]